MAETVIKRVHMLEARQKDHLSGKWSRWFLRDQHYAGYRVAKRDRDIVVQDDRDYQCRIVTFVRGRTYEAA